MKTVVVLSPPRSGSSLLTGILHKLGVNMGREKDLLKGKFINERGCYENHDFSVLNRKMLAKAGFLFAWINLPEYNTLKKVVKEFNPKIKKLIKRYEKPVWGWKDPSTSLTIPYFHQLLKKPYYIYVKRDVNRIVNSLKSLVGLSNSFKALFEFLRAHSPSTLLRLAWHWSRIVLTNHKLPQNEQVLSKVITKLDEQISKFIKGKKSLTINFDRLISNPKLMINKLVGFLDIKPSKRQLRSALSFVNPNLVHF